ncbi:unnamed protein product [Brassica rapa subsp. narinosa]
MAIHIDFRENIIPYSVDISIDGDSSDLDSLSEVDLESGGVTPPVKKLHSGETNKEDEEEDSSDKQEEEEAREGEEGEEYYGLSLQLGCSCKGDLGVAHSKTCERCGAMAINVAGEQSNQESNASAHLQTTAGQTQTETR